MAQIAFPTILNKKDFLCKFNQIQSIQNQDTLSHNNQSIQPKPTRFSQANCFPTPFRSSETSQFSTKTLAGQSKNFNHNHHKSHHSGHYHIQLATNIKEKSRLKRRISTAGNNSRFPKDFFKLEERHCSSTKNANGPDFKIRRNLFQDFMKKKIQNRTKSTVQTDKEIAVEKVTLQTQMTPKFHQPINNSPRQKYDEQNQFLFEEPDNSLHSQLKNEAEQSQEIKIKNFQIEQKGPQLGDITNHNRIQNQNRRINNPKNFLIRAKAHNLSGLKRLHRRQQSGVKMRRGQKEGEDENNELHLAITINKRAGK